MMPMQTMARIAARWNEEARARVALRGARIGRDIRVYGWPNVVCRGEIVIGDGVVILSTPAAVTLIADPGASIEIGDGAVLESGVTLHAHKRIVVAPHARVEAGALLDDLASDAPEIVVAPGRAQRAARQVPADSRVRDVLATIVPAVAGLGPRDDVRAAPGWDSLAALRAVVELEQALGASLPHDLFTRVHTLEAIERVARGEAMP